MHDSTGKKRTRASLGRSRIENPYGYDPDLPVLAGDPRLNPGKGIGINWHPSQPIRNTWSDWASADRQIFDFRKSRMLPVSISLVGEAAASRLSQLTLDQQKGYVHDPLYHNSNNKKHTTMTDIDTTLSELGDSIVSTNYPETLSSMLPNNPLTLSTAVSSSSYVPPYIHSSYGRALPTLSTFVDPNDPKYQQVSLPITSTTMNIVNPGNNNDNSYNTYSPSIVPSIDWNSLGLGHAFNHLHRNNTNGNTVTNSPSKRNSLPFRLKSSSINPNISSGFQAFSSSSSASNNNNMIPETSAYSTDMDDDETYLEDDAEHNGSRTGYSNSFYNSNNPSRNSYNHNQATADEVTLISSSRHSPSLSLNSNSNSLHNEELKSRPTRRSRVNSDHTADGLLIRSGISDNTTTNASTEMEDSLAGSAFTKSNASGGPSCCDMGFAHEYMKLRNSKKNITTAFSAENNTTDTISNNVSFPSIDNIDTNVHDMNVTGTVETDYHNNNVSINRSVPVPFMESSLSVFNTSSSITNPTNNNNDKSNNNSVRYPTGKKLVHGPPGVILPILSIVDQQRLQQQQQAVSTSSSSSVPMDIDQANEANITATTVTSQASAPVLSTVQSSSSAVHTGAVLERPMVPLPKTNAIVSTVISSLSSSSSLSSVPSVPSLVLPALVSRYSVIPYTRPRVNGTVTGETDDDEKPSSSSSRVSYSNKVLNRRIESSPAAIALLATARAGGKAAIAKLTDDQRRVLKMERAKLNKRKCRAIERAYESGLLLQVHILERVHSALQHMFTSPVSNSTTTVPSSSLISTTKSPVPLVYETLIDQLWQIYQSLNSSSSSSSFLVNNGPVSKPFSHLSSSLLRVILGIAPSNELLTSSSSLVSTAFQQFCTSAMNYQLPSINEIANMTSNSTTQPSRSTSNSRTKSRAPPPPPTRVSVRAASRQRNASNSNSATLLGNDLAMMMDGIQASSFSLYSNDNLNNGSTLDVLTTNLPAFTLGDMGVKEVSNSSSTTAAGAFATLDDTALISLSNNGPLPTPGLPVVILPAGGGTETDTNHKDPSGSASSPALIVVPPSNPLYHLQSLLRVHHNQRDRLPGLYHRNNLDRSLSINSMLLPRLANNPLSWLMQEVQRLSTQADAFSVLSFAATMPTYNPLPSYVTVLRNNQTDTELSNGKISTSRSDVKGITAELASILQLSEQQRNQLNQTLTPNAVRTERGWTRRAQVSLDYTVRVISSLRKENTNGNNTSSSGSIGTTNVTNAGINTKDDNDDTASTAANDEDEDDTTAGGGVSASSAAIQASNSLFAQLTVLSPSQRERFCAWLATQPIVKAEGPSTIPMSALPFNKTIHNGDVPDVTMETAIQTFAQKYTRPGLCIDLGGYSFTKSNQSPEMSDTTSSSRSMDPFANDPTLSVGIDIDTELDYIFGAHLLSLTEQRQTLASLKPSAPLELLGTQGYGSRVPVRGSSNGSSNLQTPSLVSLSMNSSSNGNSNTIVNNGSTHAAMAAF